jgi:hypothetical protein
VLEIDELQKALRMARERTKDIALKEKAKTLHSLLDQTAKDRVPLKT